MENTTAPYVIDVGRTSTSISEFLRSLPGLGRDQVASSKVGLRKAFDFNPFSEAVSTLEAELPSNK